MGGDKRALVFSLLDLLFDSVPDDEPYRALKMIRKKKQQVSDTLEKREVADYIYDTRSRL